jgi:hypothetical protein
VAEARGTKAIGWGEEAEADAQLEVDVEAEEEAEAEAWDAWDVCGDADLRDAEDT